MNFDIGSSGVSLPCSNRIIAARPAIGFEFEYSLKIASFCTGRRLSRSITP